MQNYSFWANLKSTVKTELEVVPVLLFKIVFRLSVLMWHFLYPLWYSINVYEEAWVINTSVNIVVGDTDK